ncbi:hypothetical protein [Neobacillus jeddahensis]|uniref:hypothetical protein n=1 Tax=Neobacillus jeddahensis TaxID=1461580 RepID=UPI00058AF4EE|nr:hypothetical protein [Neobacillus jeddahensis]
MKEKLKENSWWLGLTLGLIGIFAAIYPKAFSLLGSTTFWCEVGQIAIQYWLQLSIFTIIVLLVFVLFFLVKTKE